jgi:hypothetical protein
VTLLQACDLGASVRRAALQRQQYFDGKILMSTRAVGMAAPLLGRQSWSSPSLALLRATRHRQRIVQADFVVLSVLEGGCGTKLALLADPA